MDIRVSMVPVIEVVELGSKSVIQHTCIIRSVIPNFVLICVILAVHSLSKFDIRGVTVTIRYYNIRYRCSSGKLVSLKPSSYQEDVT